MPELDVGKLDYAYGATSNISTQRVLFEKAVAEVRRLRALLTALQEASKAILETQMIGNSNWIIKCPFCGSEVEEQDCGSPIPMKHKPYCKLEKLRLAMETPDAH